MRPFYDGVELWVLAPPDNRMDVGSGREPEQEVRLPTASTAPVVEFVGEAVEGLGLGSWLWKPRLIYRQEELIQFLQLGAC